jgi:hypothetical protein
MHRDFRVGLAYLASLSPLVITSSKTNTILLSKNAHQTQRHSPCGLHPRFCGCRGWSALSAHPHVLVAVFAPVSSQTPMAECLVAEFVALACRCRNGGKTMLTQTLAVECQHILCGALRHFLVALPSLNQKTNCLSAISFSPTLRMRAG